MIGKINNKILSRILVFIVNSITTYFFAFLYLWNGHTKLIYWTWFIFVATSNILFTIYPKTLNPIASFTVKVILHFVATFLLMIIFSWTFRSS
jgi:hypothetical protein